jgi:hypothetical protein
MRVAAPRRKALCEFVVLMRWRLFRVCRTRAGAVFRFCAQRDREDSMAGMKSGEPHGAAVAQTGFGQER